MLKSKEYYKKLINVDRNYKDMTISFLKAFFFGGLICLIGQGILGVYNLFFDNTTSSLLLSMTMITVAALLTAFGVYDEIGQLARCGLSIPITGFSNACVSAAMEYHREGIVTGVGSNCLKLAGSVIVLGTTATIIVCSIRYFFEVII
ncbi:MAG: SpoVA/SpoVAEb family sporulation membrane protein [Anaeroplasma sp.]